MSVVYTYTDEEYAALKKHRKLTPAVRATRMIVHFCACGCEVYTVYEPGHNEHLVRAPRFAPDILVCNCAAHGALCSHIRAARTHQSTRLQES